MDISTYYEEFQSEYNLAVFAVFFALFVVVFCAIRTIRDKKISAATRIFSLFLLTIILATPLYLFIVGPYSLKKDVDDKTIYLYEGVFEVVEISEGILHFDKAVFVFEDREYTLQCYKGDLQDNLITIGTYEGRIYYAENAARLMHIWIVDSLEK